MTQPPQYPAQPPYNRQTPPAAPGYPQAQPDSPTYPPNQTFPGQPPQPGSTYPQTQPTNQPYPQQPATPPPPPKNNTTTGIIITMGALLIALTIAVVYLAITKNNPTANPTPSATPTPTQTTPTQTPDRGWAVNGNQLTGPNMTAQLPQGWQTTELNGADNDGDLINPQNNSVMTYWVRYPVGGNTDEVCKSRIEHNRVSSGDSITQVSGKIWGGKAVLAYHMMVSKEKGRVIYGLHCLDNGNGAISLLQVAAWEPYKESLFQDAQTVMSTWQWK